MRRFLGIFTVALCFLGSASVSLAVNYPELPQKEATMMGQIDECRVWWIFVLLWLAVSSVVYLVGANQKVFLMGSIAQLLFWLAAIFLLVASLIFGLDCAWWPAVIVGVGAPLVYFVTGRPEEQIASVI